MSSSLLIYSVPTLILIAGVVDDLRARKVQNRLVLVCAAIAITFVLIQWGISGVGTALISLSVAFLLYTPLVYLRILGAGDMKLMMAFALSTDWNAVLNVSIFALLWGALLGLVRALISGQLLDLFRNTLSVAILKTDIQENAHKIPYTVALLFGWMSHLAYGGGLL